MLKKPTLRMGHADPSSPYNRTFSFLGSGACWLEGSARFELVGDIADYSGFFFSENPDANVRLKLDYHGAQTPNTESGPFSSINYLVSNGADTRTNISDFTTYVETLGGL